MTAQEMIQKYSISLNTVWDSEAHYFMPTGKIFFRNAKTEAERSAIAAKKGEIISILMPKWEEEKRAHDERQAKIDAIEGLRAIKEAQAELDAWHDKFERSFSGPNACGGLNVGPRPAHDLDAMKEAYPRAAAYLEAESWSCADHDVKASAGAAALEKIINGADYREAVAEMEKKWSDYCANRWD